MDDTERKMLIEIRDRMRRLETRLVIMANEMGMGHLFHSRGVPVENEYEEPVEENNDEL